MLDQNIEGILKFAKIFSIEIKESENDKVSETQKEHLKRRLEEYNKNPENVREWDVFKKEILNNKN